MTGPCFEFRSVSKSYGEKKALSGVSFSVAVGDHTTVLGPSGSGKSTALRCWPASRRRTKGKFYCKAS